MLDTLLKIGEWQSEGKSEWDRFLDYPKTDKEDKYGNTIKNYTLPIVFDLDEKEVTIIAENLQEYDESIIQKSIALKIKGGNNKAIYAAASGNKLVQLYKTFFGKEGENAEHGELMEAFAKTYQELLTSNFKKLLSEIHQMKDKFLELTFYPDKNKIDLKALTEAFDFSKNENIILIVTKVKAGKFGYPEPVLFSEIPEYKEFLEKTFLGSDKPKSSKQTKRKLCYASGDLLDDVGELNLSTRYSLNKMFVTETKNYASLFHKKKFPVNYQVSSENQEKLDYASDYLLNKGYKVRIAGIDHVIIPQFQQNSDLDLEMTLDGIHKKSDILFSLRKLNQFSENIKDETEDAVYWINFLAFESDGNFFKSTEIIKDVSDFYFNKILNAFTDIDWQFDKASFVDWNAVMTEYDKKTNERLRTNLNFNSFFNVIPVRKGNRNIALLLFKDILENRPVKKELLYDCFCELILCHWFGRNRSYTNMQVSSKDYFYIAVRDSVFKYHAFSQVLKKLKLIDMEEMTSTHTGNKYDMAIVEFFKKMALNENQQAMFYLGRLLNKVEYLQKDKNKTVIQKVNFNGMDKDDIQRLRIDLIEKAKQYNAIGKVIFIDKNFGSSFDTNGWDMNPKEAVFFLLTGYSFGVGKKETKELNEKETEITH